MYVLDILWRYKNFYNNSGKKSREDKLVLGFWGACVKSVSGDMKKFKPDHNS